MKVTVNGNEMDVCEGAYLDGLLGTLGLSDKRVAVELNRAIIHRDTYTTSALKDGDVLEIISFVGGG